MDPKYEIALKKAVQNEDDAFDLYSNPAKKSPDDLGLFFSKLAIQEKRHKRILELFSLTGDIDKARMQVKAESSEDYYHEDGADFLSTEELRDSFKHAIKKEQESFELYQGLYSQAIEENIKDLFQMLMEMEIGHKRILKKEYQKHFHDNI